MTNRVFQVKAAVNEIKAWQESPLPGFFIVGGFTS